MSANSVELYRIVLLARRSLERSAIGTEHSFQPSVGPHMSSGDTGDWIGMPFGVVSGVGLGMGVLY